MRRFGSLLTVAGMLGALATPPARAQAPAGGGGAPACVPACRSGFACHQGRCVSLCNPPCDASETCTSSGDCVPTPPAVPPRRPSSQPANRPSQAGDPTTADCLDANESSVKLRNEHKLRATRAQLLVCAAASCPADIRSECSRQVDALNSAIPTVIFQAKDAEGSDIVAVRVTMDGEPIAERLVGTPISVDPGAHEFIFEAAGQPPVSKNLVIHEAQKDRLETIVLGHSAASAAAPPQPPPQPQPQPPPLAPQPPVPEADQAPQQNSGKSTKKVFGFILGGVGLTALGVALIEQLAALGLDSDSHNAANNPDPTVQGTVHSLHEQALAAQNIAIASGVIGVAALGTGVILLATSSSGSSTPVKATGWNLVPELGPHGGRFVLQVTW